MMKLDFKRHFLPHILAVLLFLLLTVIFYWPVVMEGKGIFQNDAYQGIAAGKEVAEFREATGEEALWIHSMFGGMPAYLINTRHYGEWLIEGVQAVLTFQLPSPAWLTFLSMLSFYILLLVFRVRPVLAMAGAIAYGLSTFSLISIEAGHNWKVGAMATMPLVLAGIHATLHLRMYWGFIGTILALGLQLKMNHLQITYYLLLCVLIYGAFHLYYFIKDGRLLSKVPAFLLLLCAALLAVGMSMGRLWVTSEYSRYSQRGPSELQMVLTEDQSTKGLDKEYAFNWSLGKMETFTLMMPNFYGGASIESLTESSALYESLLRQGANAAQARSEIQQVRTYWGNQPFTSGPVYAGIVLVILLILATILLPSRQKYWMLSTIALSIILAWGKNFEIFNYTMFDYFPGYNKFRAVSMAVVIALMIMPLMAMLGIEAFIKQVEQKAQAKNAVLLLGKIIGGLLVLLFVLYLFFDFVAPSDAQMLAGGYPDWYIDAVQSDRASLYMQDWLRTLIFSGIVIAVLFFFQKGALKASYLTLTMVLLMIADLYPVGLRYLHPENYTNNPAAQFLQFTDADRFISNANEDARVIYLLNPWNDARVSYHHQSIGGYHGAKLRRYQELIDWHLDYEHGALVDSLQNGASALPFTPVMNMLNTGHYIAGRSTEAAIRNPYAAGNAWFINDLYAVETPDEELLGLSEINIYSQAITTKIETDREYEADGEVRLIERRPNFLKYTYSTVADGFAVFSEIYYPKGWQAFINGEEVSILQVNYVLRGLEIPQGEGEITFHFRPDSYFLGNQIANWSNWLVVMLVLLGIVLEWRTRDQLKP